MYSYYIRGDRSPLNYPLCIAHYGLTTPNASHIETHVNCLKLCRQISQFFDLLNIQCSISGESLKFNVLVQKQARYGRAYQTYFRPRPLACKNVTTIKIELKSLPSLTDQTYIISTHCIITSLHFIFLTRGWNSRTKNSLYDDFIIISRHLPGFRLISGGEILICKSRRTDKMMASYYTTTWQNQQITGRDK